MLPAMSSAITRSAVSRGSVAHRALVRRRTVRLAVGITFGAVVALGALAVPAQYAGALTTPPVPALPATPALPPVSSLGQAPGAAGPLSAWEDYFSAKAASFERTLATSLDVTTQEQSFASLFKKAQVQAKATSTPPSAPALATQTSLFKTLAPLSAKDAPSLPSLPAPAATPSPAGAAPNMAQVWGAAFGAFPTLGGGGVPSLGQSAPAYGAVAVNPTYAVGGRPGASATAAYDQFLASCGQALCPVLASPASLSGFLASQSAAIRGSAVPLATLGLAGLFDAQVKADEHATGGMGAISPAAAQALMDAAAGGKANLPKALGSQFDPLMKAAGGTAKTPSPVGGFGLVCHFLNFLC